MLRQPPHDDPLHLWEINFEEIDFVDVQGIQREYKIEFANNAWWADVGDERYQVDQVRLKNHLNSLLHPHAGALLGDGGESLGDLKLYGLDPAVTRIEIGLKAGDQHKLAVGYETPLGGTYYVQADDHSAVYLLPRFDLESLLEGQIERLKVRKN